MRSRPSRRRHIQRDLQAHTLTVLQSECNVAISPCTVACVTVTTLNARGWRLAAGGWLSMSMSMLMMAWLALCRCHWHWRRGRPAHHFFFVKNRRPRVLRSIRPRLRVESASQSPCLRVGPTCRVVSAQYRPKPALGAGPGAGFHP